MRHVVLDRDVQRRRADDGRRDDGRVLHLEERLDGFHFRLVREIGHRATFGRQPARGHPFGVLLLLCTRDRTV